MGIRVIRQFFRDWKDYGLLVSIEVFFRTIAPSFFREEED